MSTDRPQHPIDGEERVTDQRDRCEVCEEPIGWDGVTMMSWQKSEVIDAWGFCDQCYRLLKETIQVEVTHGPGTPPPQAWTKVRRLRAARLRRWGKADP